jgi:flagellar biogenesis protein FliO
VNRALCRLAGTGALLVVAACARGQGEAAEPGGGAGGLSDLPSFGESLVKMIVSLAVILTLLLILARVLPRWLGRGSARAVGGGEIEILASRPLEPRRRLYLLRVCGKKILVGSSESGLCRLAGEELNDAAAPARSVEPSQTGPGATVPRIDAPHTPR